MKIVIKFDSFKFQYYNIFTKDKGGKDDSIEMETLWRSCQAERQDQQVI